MKKNIKTVGLLALLVGGLLMSFAIPAMAVTPPWMLCDAGREDGRGGGVDSPYDPHMNPYIDCYNSRQPNVLEGELSLVTYLRSCSICGEYKYAIALSAGVCKR